jgi:nucleoside-diphosphate-sugar epimerase
VVHILVTGAAGMIGRKLVEALVRAGGVGAQPIEELTLADVVAPTAPAGFSGAVETLALDIAAPGAAAKLIGGRPELIFHVAAIPSGGAEADFEGGYHANLDGTRGLLEAIRLDGQRERYVPRFVFTSTVAVFGEPLPDVIADDFHTTPLTSYGTQKSICELLVNDYSRRGFVDGLSIRLPTIVIRPGRPNAAASGFFSNILREPLVGREAVLPVGRELRHWFASPRAAVGFLLHAAAMDTTDLGWRTISAPGLSATVGEEIEALRRVAGDRAASLIREVPDERIGRIVRGWARSFDPRRALELGFVADRDFDEIIRIHIEDELGGRVP